MMSISLPHTPPAARLDRIRTSLDSSNASIASTEPMDGTSPASAARSRSISVSQSNSPATSISPSSSLRIKNGNPYANTYTPNPRSQPSYSYDSTNSHSNTSTPTMQYTTLQQHPQQHQMSMTYTYQPSMRWNTTTSNSNSPYLGTSGVRHLSDAQPLPSNMNMNASKSQYLWKQPSPATLNRTFEQPQAHTSPQLPYNLTYNNMIHRNFHEFSSSLPLQSPTHSTGHLVVAQYGAGLLNDATQTQAYTQAQPQGYASFSSHSPPTYSPYAATRQLVNMPSAQGFNMNAMPTPISNFDGAVNEGYTPGLQVRRLAEQFLSSLPDDSPSTRVRHIRHSSNANNSSTNSPLSMKRTVKLKEKERDNNSSTSADADPGLAVAFEQLKFKRSTNTNNNVNKQNSNRTISNSEISNSPSHLSKRLTGAARWKALHDDIMAFAIHCQTTQEHQQSIRDELVQRINSAIRSVWPEAIVDVVGSVAAGTALPKSDLDFVIHFPLMSEKPKSYFHAERNPSEPKESSNSNNGNSSANKNKASSATGIQYEVVDCPFHRIEATEGEVKEFYANVETSAAASVDGDNDDKGKKQRNEDHGNGDALQGSEKELRADDVDRPVATAAGGDVNESKKPLYHWFPSAGSLLKLIGGRKKSKELFTSTKIQVFKDINLIRLRCGWTGISIDLWFPTDVISATRSQKHVVSIKQCIKQYPAFAPLSCLVKTFMQQNQLNSGYSGLSAFGVLLMIQRFLQHHNNINKQKQEAAGNESEGQKVSEDEHLNEAAGSAEANLASAASNQESGIRHERVKNDENEVEGNDALPIKATITDSDANGGKTVDKQFEEKNMGKLLYEFFRYYCQFDYVNKAISVAGDGDIVDKPVYDTLASMNMNGDMDDAHGYSDHEEERQYEQREGDQENGSENENGAGSEDNAKPHSISVADDDGMYQQQHSSNGKSSDDASSVRVPPPASASTIRGSHNDASELESNSGTTGESRNKTGTLGGRDKLKIRALGENKFTLVILDPEHSKNQIICHHKALRNIVLAFIKACTILDPLTPPPKLPDQLVQSFNIPPPQAQPQSQADGVQAAAGAAKGSSPNGMSGVDGVVSGSESLDPSTDAFYLTHVNPFYHLIDIRAASEGPQTKPCPSNTCRNEDGTSKTQCPIQNKLCFNCGYLFHNSITYQARTSNTNTNNNIASSRREVPSKSNAPLGYSNSHSQWHQFNNNDSNMKLTNNANASALAGNPRQGRRPSSSRGGQAQLQIQAQAQQPYHRAYSRSPTPLLQLPSTLSAQYNVPIPMMIQNRSKSGGYNIPHAAHTQPHPQRTNRRNGGNYNNNNNNSTNRYQPNGAYRNQPNYNPQNTMHYYHPTGEVASGQPDGANNMNLNMNTHVNGSGSQQGMAMPVSITMTMSHPHIIQQNDFPATIQGRAMSLTPAPTSTNQSLGHFNRYNQPAHMHVSGLLALPTSQQHVDRREQGMGVGEVGVTHAMHPTMQTFDAKLLTDPNVMAYLQHQQQQQPVNQLSNGVLLPWTASTHTTGNYSYPTIQYSQ